MPGRWQKLVMMVAAVALLSGCASVRKNVNVRGYIEDRPRVDQEMSGNAGYIMGTPKPEDRSDYKTTRRMYVLEVSKEATEPKVEEKVITETSATTTSSYVDTTATSTSDYDDAAVEDVSSVSQRSSRPEPQFVIPSFTDEVPEAPVEPTAMQDVSSPSGNFVDYKVEKDDTLQKISKKFFNTYKKWPAIYEANKDKIKNPDRIKPGITIRIPQE